MYPCGLAAANATHDKIINTFIFVNYLQIQKLSLEIVRFVAVEKKTNCVRSLNSTSPIAIDVEVNVDLMI